MSVIKLCITFYINCRVSKICKADYIRNGQETKDITDGLNTESKVKTGISIEIVSIDEINMNEARIKR